MKRLLVVGVLVLATASLAGCIGSDDAPAGEDAATASTPESNNTTVAPFSISKTKTVGYEAGVGAAGASGGVVPADGCPTQVFDMPANATAATVTIAGPVVNTTQPGVGSGVMTVTTAADEAVRQDQGTSDAVEFSFEDPESGEWTVDVSPNGAAISQRWAMTIGIQGESAEEPSISLSGTCGI